MPNTSSAKKALRGSEKKRGFNNTRKYKITQSLKELRRVLANKPSEYQTTLSKVFSSLDKAVKSNLIPKKRADRKKSRVSAMVEKALGNEVASKTAQKAKKRAAKAAKPKVVAKKPATKKPTIKKAEPKKEVKKVEKKAPAKKATAKTTTKKPAAKKAPAKKPAAKKTK